MVWNTNEEAEIMGRKREPIQEPGPKVLSTQSPHYVTLPTYARLQMPLTTNDARLRRMAEELRGLANEIDFCNRGGWAMADSMIEDVARAIAAKKCGLANDGSNLPDDIWRQALPIARAAIEAMREPSPEMTDSGFQSLYAGEGEHSLPDLVETVYREMIAAALATEATPPPPKPPKP